MKSIIYLIALLIIVSSCNLQKHYVESIPKVKNTLQLTTQVNLSKPQKHEYISNELSISPIPLKQPELINLYDSKLKPWKLNKTTVFSYKKNKLIFSTTKQTKIVRPKFINRKYSEVNISKVILIVLGILLTLIGWPIFLLGTAFSAFGAIFLGALILLVGLILLIVGITKPKAPVKIQSLDNKSKQEKLYQDVIYLKDGSIIRGTIIATIPHEFIKIQTQDENITVIRMDKVEKITKEKIN